MNKPILISAGVICAIILVSGFLNQSQNNTSPNNENNSSQQDPKQKEIVDNLDNIAKVDGAEIGSRSGFS